jgi:hypothetical protein
VHFFDSPLPRWPTFAINLRDVHPRAPIDPNDQTRNVFLPQDNGDGLLEWWNRLDPDDVYLAGFRDLPRPGAATNATAAFPAPPVLFPPPERRNLTGFLGAILHTMQNWSDNTQIGLPGFRDRIAHVSLGKQEGGFNLRMPEDVIKHLAARGEFAGKELRERFTTRQETADFRLTWANHRWVRYRRTMAALHSYELTEAQRAFAPGATRRIARVGRMWGRAPGALDKSRVPRPVGRLRITPKL